MTIPTDQTPEARRYATDDGASCVCVILKDEAGLPHEVFADEHDWDKALAVAASWSVVHRYEPSVPLVISEGPGTLRHPERSKRDHWLLLANLIMEPPERETVRFLDGNPFNFSKHNLVVRPKGTRTIPKKGKTAITEADLHKAREREMQRREEQAEILAYWASERSAHEERAEAARKSAANPRDLLKANLVAMAAFRGSEGRR